MLYPSIMDMLSPRAFPDGAPPFSLDMPAFDLRCEILDVFDFASVIFKPISPGLSKFLKLPRVNLSPASSLITSNAERVPLSF